MGGYGSGRYYGSTVTSKLDDGLQLDINRLVKQGHVTLDVHRSGFLSWSRIATGEKVASIGYEVNTINLGNMWLRIYYTHTPYGGDAKQMDYKIKLTTSRPNYGGERLWFVCPITGKRASVLHSPQGSDMFASRHAFNLKYKSQSQTSADRAIEKKWKAKHKLGGDSYYIKPKGMHQKTYQKLLGDYWKQEEVCDTFLLEYMNSRLLER